MVTEKRMSGSFTEVFCTQVQDLCTMLAQLKILTVLFIKQNPEQHTVLGSFF